MQVKYFIDGVEVGLVEIGGPSEVFDLVDMALTLMGAPCLSDEGYEDEEDCEECEFRGRSECREHGKD